MELTTETNKVLEKIEKEKGWVIKRYSLQAIYKKLKLWEENLMKLGSKNELIINPDEIYKYFYMSYFRSIGSKKYESRLVSQLNSCITNIKKDRLLYKFGINSEFNLDNDRWREFKLERLEKRFTFWQNSIKKSLPEIDAKDVFRFFRKRYLQVAEKRFISKEIPVGIRNTKEFIKKKNKLKQLYITENHPQFEQYIKMAPWEFNRKFKTLKRALDLAQKENLNFPLTKNSTNKREFFNHLKGYSPKDRPNNSEEILYKLILHFNGMTQSQIENIVYYYNLKSISVGKILDKLIYLELIEDNEISEDIYYTRISDSARKELVIEKWLEDLRRNISIGTGEALSYLEDNYQNYSIKKLQNDILPKTSKKILDDRREFLQKMGIDMEDPRYYHFIQQKKNELLHELKDFEDIIHDFKENNIEIPEDYKFEISSYSENGNEEKDTKVLWLIMQLNESTYTQLSNIYKNLNSGKIGFKLKASLTRLSISGLIKISKSGILHVVKA